MSAPLRIVAVELRARRLSTLAWFLGALATSGAVVSLFPVFVGNEAVQSLVDRMPRPLMLLFGVDPETITSGVGFLQAQLYTFLAPMLLLAFAIGAGARGTAGEEEARTAEILLAQPVARGLFVLAKLACLTLVTALVVTGIALPLVVANGAGRVDVPGAGILGASVGLFLLGAVHGTLAMAAGAWSGKSALGAGVAASYALVGFLVAGLSPMVPLLEPVAMLTPFHWYQHGNPMVNGPTAAQGVLALAVVGLGWAAMAAFRGRDLGTSPRWLSTGMRQVRHGARRATRRGRRPRSPRLVRLLGSAYGKALWDRRLTLFLWMGGLCGLAAATGGFWPTIEASSQDLEQLIELVPEELFAAFGIEDPALLLTPAGFLSSRVFATVGLVLMLIFSIGGGAAAVAGEERRGTLELELSTPVPRGRLALEKLAGLATLLGLFGAALFVTMIVTDAVVGLGLRPLHVLAACVSLAAVSLFFGALALAVGCWTGNANLARGLPFAVALGGFVGNIAAAAVEGLRPLRLASPLSWYLGDTPILARGFTWGLVPLVAGSVVLAALSTRAIDRRDIG